MGLVDCILNSDDYQRGYHEGYSDGLNGKERNNFRKGLSMGLSMKFAIHGRNALETFSKGYEEGYRKGIEDRHSKAQPQIVEVVKQTKDLKSQNGNKSVFNTYQTSKSMASLQDYQIQLEQLNELVRFLNQFKDEMNDKLNEYVRRIEVLRENGLAIQTAQRFEVDHIAETGNLIRQIQQLIEDRSIPFTYQNIELTENLITLNS